MIQRKKLLSTYLSAELSRHCNFDLTVMGKTTVQEITEITKNWQQQRTYKDLGHCLID